MDIFRQIECIEFVFTFGYYIVSEHKERHATRVSLLSWALALITDVGLLHGMKPHWAWIALNVTFLWYLYEKLLRKYALSMYQHVAATVSAMRD